MHSCSAHHAAETTPSKTNKNQSEQHKEMVDKSAHRCRPHEAASGKPKVPEGQTPPAAKQTKQPPVYYNAGVMCRLRQETNSPTPTNEGPTATATTPDDGFDCNTPPTNDDDDDDDDDGR